jgi:putative thioredoxin
MENEIEVNDKNFQENVIEQSKKKPVVVDFWASWCRPCMMIAPILEKLAKEYGGKVILAKYNIEDNSQFAQKYSVMSIPNVKFFKNGKVVDEFIGAIPEEDLKSWLEKNIIGESRKV